MINSLLSGSQTITEVSHECPPESDLFSFINFTLNELEGIEFISFFRICLGNVLIAVSCKD